VVEGCGSNGCEYMTGGTAVIIGPVGENFGAGMTGGMAFVYDPKGEFDAHANVETIEIDVVQSRHWEAVLRNLVTAHVEETGSPKAAELLRNWDQEMPHFRQICPKEMLSRLEHPLSDIDASVSA